jgi:hypothetical protein
VVDGPPSTHFAAQPLDYSVPTLGDGYGFYATAAGGWATLDLDGDGLVDLVHTADPDTGRVWGGDANPTWHVYLGQTDGFAPTWTSWKVPTLGDGYGFYALAAGTWATLDLDNDGHVDLVHTADPMSGEVWGGDTNASWRVYPGQASGFAPTPTNWKVPALGDGYGFYAVAASGWATLDLDGDEHVDLVHTADPMSGKVWGGDSNASWRVYLGQANGFATASSMWKVPTLGDGYGFYATAAGSWATIDLDGDHHADLVHTADPMSGNVWGGDDDASWRVYLGDASGFTPLPSTWKVPPLGDGYGFYAIASSTWATLDLDGDRHVDLVHTADPMSGGVWGGDESAFWKVFRGEP